MMAKAGKWSKIKTIAVTITCGAGHVLSSVLLGAVGIAAGLSLNELAFIEGSRGEIAGWLLVSFGFIYMVWGIKKAYRSGLHSHTHFSRAGAMYSHSHKHEGKHVHQNGNKTFTPWILFVIFILGPCEPLIPLLMFPAANQSVTGLILVALVFGVVTIGTMLSIVMISLYGINFVHFGKLEKFTHALAGFAIFVSGLAINFLGL
jgi:sulfite exporter TauE/SafE